MTHRLTVAVLCTYASACLPAPPVGVGDSAPSSTSSASDGHSETGLALPGTTTTGPTTSGDATSTSSTTTSDGFIVAPDGGGPQQQCDPFAQDCPPGQKCTWWSEDGSYWNATKCVQIADDPAQVGEPCFTEGGGLDGEDDCDLGMMCWDVDLRGEGTCIAFCTGDEYDPTCPTGHVCNVGREGFTLCIPNCDPLAQDCPGADLCLPTGDTYLCTPDASGDAGQLHDPCEYINTCDPGLVCLGPAASPECDQDASGCCMPMCALDDPTCPDPGQTCLPMYDPQPPDFPNVGYCSVTP